MIPQPGIRFNSAWRNSMNEGYDLITIGGGIAAASLARAMAEKGSHVLVLERETEFKDRIRGEALLPWGVDEARKLGIYDLLRTCGHEQQWLDVYLGPDQLMHRDLLTTTPQQAPVCSFYHPTMQETLIKAAANAGAEVRRGAVVTNIVPGPQPVVNYQYDGTGHEVRGRFVAAADGRVSVARKWGGFTVEHDPPSLMLAGVLLDNAAVPEDISYIMTNPMSYRGAFAFPQGGGRARAYFAYPVDAGFRLQGESDFPRFIEECLKSGAPPQYYQGAKAAGPLASFEAADTWVPHPYKLGLALLGDAAASSDPSWGNGLSLSLRSARILRDCLQANQNWDAAGHEYAVEFDHVYDVIHNVTTWSRQIFMENGPQADLRREKVMPLIAQDPMRVPDHGISGPDLPFDKDLSRARFFGEA
jgi:2-polyprenyl-6-methoxyphenol hydroxylase-like FAD-dependent oxidoreductase